MVFHLVCRIADPPLILASLALKARALVSMNDYSGGLACAAAATLVLRPGTYDLFEMMEIAKMPVTRDNDTPSVSFQYRSIYQFFSIHYSFSISYYYIITCCIQMLTVKHSNH